jgi:hypothetical protein
MTDGPIEVEANGCGDPPGACLSVPEGQSPAMMRTSRPRTSTGIGLRLLAGALPGAAVDGGMAVSGHGHPHAVERTTTHGTAAWRCSRFRRSCAAHHADRRQQRPDKRTADGLVADAFLHCLHQPVMRRRLVRREDGRRMCAIPCVEIASIHFCGMDSTGAEGAAGAMGSSHSVRHVAALPRPR